MRPWAVSLGLILGVALVPPTAAQRDGQSEAEALAAAANAKLNTAAPGFGGLSFMLNQAERDALAAAQAGTATARDLEPLIEPEPEADPDPEPVTTGVGRDVHLQGLIFVEGGGWAAWVNNRPVTPEQNAPLDPGQDVIVTAVGPDGVALSWGDGSLDRPYSAVLQPNQSYRSRDGVIGEGAPPEAASAETPLRSPPPPPLPRLGQP